MFRSKDRVFRDELLLEEKEMMCIFWFLPTVFLKCVELYIDFYFIENIVNVNYLIFYVRSGMVLVGFARFVLFFLVYVGTSQDTSRYIVYTKLATQKQKN